MRKFPRKTLHFSKDLRIVHSMMEIRMFLASILCSMILIIQIKIIIKNSEHFITTKLSLHVCGANTSFIKKSLY